MRAGLVALLLLACAAAPAQAARVDLMVVGKSKVLRPAKPVTLHRATVKVDGRRCRVAGATPLGALARTPLKRRLHLRDYGSCSRRPADASGLYVRGIGADVERGRDGWVYKIGPAAPSVGAGDPAGRLRRGDRVLWFWCRMGVEGCQRTLEVRPEAAAAAAGESLRVRVVAHDDDGRAVPAAGATVRIGSARARAGDDGTATLTVPGGRAARSVVAMSAGLVRSFPARIRVR